MAGPPRARRRLVLPVLAVVFVAMVVVAADPPEGAKADVTAYANDTSNTGWYSDSDLSPALVAGGTFGTMFDTALPDRGQVYGQPIVSNGTLLVATQKDNAYGLDPISGAIRWSRNLGTPFNPADINCGDITPSVGVTGTPVVDAATNTAYMVAKSYVSGTSGAVRQQMHAIDVTTGAERAGFPVTIGGVANNDPAVSYNGGAAISTVQRPGLLLHNGVIYAGFATHCDYGVYGEFRGWVFGVGAVGQPRTAQITARWVSEAGQGANPGGGIWQSGGALVADGPGQLLLTTGNGNVPANPTPGGQPPGALGQAVVRLAVQTNGTLKATDFFAPYDAKHLNTIDGDFGSGAPVALPTSYGGTHLFGSASVPRLMVQVGKEGYVYLLDRDALGGYQQGAGGGDSVVDRVGPDGGVWAKPAVWPGDGGWVNIVTSTGVNGMSGTLHAYRYGVDGAGRPTLSLAGTAKDAQGDPDPFGYTSSAGVVTSKGLRSGSAVLWAVWSTGQIGYGGQLRAYNPVPVNGKLQLLGSWPMGTATKFALPAYSGNRIYVGNRDGHVLSFGSPVTTPVESSGPSFPQTIVTHHSTSDLVLTANADLVINRVTSSNSQFVPNFLNQDYVARGQQFSVPVTFTPTAAGLASTTLRVDTSRGPMQIAASGRGQEQGPVLVASPSLISFGSVPVDPLRPPSSQGVTLTNVGARPLAILSVSGPASSAFHITGLPTPGTDEAVLAPGQSIAAAVTFAPNQTKQYLDEVDIATYGGTSCADLGKPANVCSLALSGVGTPPAHLQLSNPPAVTAGVGQSASTSFTLKNTGGSVLTITKSKPPQTGGFSATTLLPEGSRLNPGATLTETVRFAPRQPGSATSSWAITGDDDTGAHIVTFNGTGTGTAPPNANAGPDRSVTPGSAVQLDGTGSTSGDTRSLTYLWDQTAGAAVTLDNRRLARPRFVAPSGGANLTFRLTITNSSGLTDTDTVSVRVSTK